MENKNQTAQVSAAPLNGGATSSGFATTDSRYYPIENLEGPSTATLEQASSNAPDSQSAPSSSFAPQFTAPTPPKRLKRKLVIPAIVLLGITAATLAGWLWIRSNQQAQQQLAEQVPEQGLEFTASESGLAGLTVDAAAGQVLINGNIVTTGSLYVSGTDGVFGQITVADLSQNQTYELPNASGTLCLDNNNCGFALANQGIGSLVAGQGITIAGNTIASSQTFNETSLNNLSGAITLQGTANRIGVSTNNGIITLTSPQDIATTSSPTFNSITLTGVGTQNGNVLCDISNNCGYAGGTNAFVQGGNAFGATAIIGTTDNENLSIITNGIERALIGDFLGASFAGFVVDSFVIQTPNNGVAFRVTDSSSGAVLTAKTNNGRVYIGTVNDVVPSLLNVRGSIDGAGACGLSCWGQYIEAQFTNTGINGTVGGIRIRNSLGSSTTASAYHGIFIDEPSLGVGANITTVSGLTVVPISTGASSYGIRVGVAGTQTLQIGYAVDATTANAGIAFGSSRDTNLYRGAANQLRTDDSLFVAGNANIFQNTTDSTTALQVRDADGGNPVLNVDTTNERVGIGTAAPTTALHVVSMPADENAGSIIFVEGTDTTTDNSLTMAIRGQLTASPTSPSSAHYIGVAGGAYSDSSNWTTGGQLTGIFGAGLYGGTGTIDAINGLLIENQNTSSGTVDDARGIYVRDAINSGSINSNYGIHVAPQTAGILDFGVRIDAADTQTLWLSGNADNTTAAAGIAFGASRDTNLYRSAANTLRTDDNLQAAGHVAIGSTASVSSSNVVSISETFTQTSGTQIGTLVDIDVAPTGGDSSGTTVGSVILLGTVGNNDHGSLMGSNLQIAHNGDGDLNGIIGQYQTLENAGDGNISSAAGAYYGFANQGAGVVSGVTGLYLYSSNADGTIMANYGIGIEAAQNGLGTIELNAGLLVSTASVSGGGSITDNYGVHVQAQTAGTNDYGIRVDTADTQTLWVSGDADSTTANAGIAFGSSRDTNLYRSAANTLRTDDLLSVGGGITVPGLGAASERFGSSASATGDNSTALGNSATANSDNSVAIGASSSAALRGVALGRNAAANQDGVVIGHGASGSGGGLTNMVVVGSGAASTGASGIALGSQATVAHSGSIAIGRSAATTAANQLVIGGPSLGISMTYIGNGVTNASPLNTVINATGGSGADVAGASLTLAGGRGTGAANGGSILFQTTAPGASSSTLGTLTTVATIQGGSGATTFQNSTDSTSGFKVMDADGGVSVFNVDTDNERVGIGLDAPTVSLDVLSAGADGTTVAQFMNAGAESCTVQPGGTGFSCSSDARLKTNIATVVDPLEVIRGLRGATFNWNSDPNGQAHVGFIAQELEQLIPSAVSTDSRGYKVANYSAIIPYLVGAAQEQDLQISGLGQAHTSLQQLGSANQSAVASLGQRLTRLEQQMANLEQSSGQGGGNSFASLNVSGAATVGTLKVTGSATISSLTVTGNASFAGDIAVAGDLYLSGRVLGNHNTRGTITVEAGAAIVEHTFYKAFSDTPNVVLTATNAFAPAYRVEATPTGFKLYLENAAASNITFNYHVQQ